MSFKSGSKFTYNTVRIFTIPSGDQAYLQAGEWALLRAKPCEYTVMLSQMFQSELWSMEPTRPYFSPIVVSVESSNLTVAP